MSSISRFLTVLIMVVSVFATCVAASIDDAMSAARQVNGQA
ncbi:hypothetical protein HMPREF0758_0878 [Serratia odorifera DSM 4582]|uniref:Uncharacterized protein n=1 Tax=Serratia odorifera DSM 4582 TaxID=667129 RepID=D4DY95_SEROD|nr:hypothetical protein HMPREF0758_0878 [Serratia odorifera DSM 4582]